MLGDEIITLAAGGLVALAAAAGVTGVVVLVVKAAGAWGASGSSLTILGARGAELRRRHWARAGVVIVARRWGGASSPSILARKHDKLNQHFKSCDYNRLIISVSKPWIVGSVYKHLVEWEQSS